MTEDDNALRGIDLDAWAQPPPSPQLADAVIAELKQPARAAARDLHEVRGRGRLPRWAAVAAAGAIGALLAAAGVLAILRPRPADAPASSRGEVAAISASHLALGPSSAELESGAEVRWWRDRHRISIAQSRGAVRWNAGDEDTLLIDVGAAVASIEASGASLRVEAHMDRTVIGMSVAAVVATVSVIVYDGEVKVASAGTTQIVSAGQRVDIEAPAPVRDGPRVGGAPVDPLRSGQRTVASQSAPTQNVPPSALEGYRTRGEKNIVPDDETKKAIADSGEKRVTGSFKLCIDAQGAVTSVTRLKSTGFAAYDSKIESEMKQWAYRPFPGDDGKPVAVCTAVTFIYSQR